MTAPGSYQWGAIITEEASHKDTSDPYSPRETWKRRWNVCILSLQYKYLQHKYCLITTSPMAVNINKCLINANYPDFRLGITSITFTWYITVLSTLYIFNHPPLSNCIFHWMIDCVLLVVKRETEGGKEREKRKKRQREGEVQGWQTMRQGDLTDMNRTKEKMSKWLKSDYYYSKPFRIHFIRSWTVKTQENIQKASSRTFLSGMLFLHNK